MSKNNFKPGNIVPTSGQYKIVGSRGGETGNERTCVKGEHFPPTPNGGQQYILIDPTKHK